MIWATVSFQSCFCWLYRASPSLVEKNIINLILVLTIWWCPRVESSLVLLEDSVCYDQSILLAKLCYPLPWFILYSKAKFACYSRYLLTSYVCIPSTLWWKGYLFLVLVLGGLHRTIPDWSIDLDYCDIEWLVLEMNRGHSGVFETASKYYI